VKNQSNFNQRIFIDKIDTGIRETLINGLNYIQWDKIVDKNSRVFIKPNFTSPQPEKGVTTNPSLLRALLDILAGRTSAITVGESDGGNHSFKAEEAFEGHDMYRICKETGARLVSLSTLPVTTVESTILGKKVQVELPKLLVDDIDCFITVPVLKVHVMTTISLSLKNSWGCLPDTMRGMHHQNLPYKLALIASRLKPKIVVVDGIYALDGHGPMYGEAVDTNLIMVGNNTVATDALGAAVMGFSPDKVQHIRIAEKAGLGAADLHKIKINQDWQPFRKHFHIKKTFVDTISKIPFNSDALAKLIFQSPITPLIYKVIGLFRTSKEKEIASQLGKNKRIGPY
jgi:uncharacterized protein (DUF362 family)